MATRSTTKTGASAHSLPKAISASNPHTKTTPPPHYHHAKQKSSSSSPNHLNLNSRPHQASKLNLNKSSTATTDHSSANQNILRRRSFDVKPVSSSPRVQKPLISPLPRDTTPPLLPKDTTRSSSFSGRSTSTTTIPSRPVLDRSTTSLLSRPPLDGKSSFAPKAPKAVKPQPLLFTSRTTKKSAKTKECNASSSSTRSSNQETKQEDEKQCQINDEVTEDAVKVETEKQVLHDHDDMIPKSKNNEEDHDHQNEKMIDNKTCEIPTVSSEDQNVLNRDTHMEDKSQEEAKIEESPKEIDVVVVEADEVGEEKGEGTSSDHHDIGDENKVEEKAHQDGEEGGGEQVAIKQEAGNGNSAGTHNWGGRQGRKESPTAYNDVIEETASKLLEKRKNRVKALVGAFETVIDYETAASK